MRDTLGSIVQYIRDIVEDSAQDSIYKRWVNDAVAAIAREYAWNELNAQKSVTVAGGLLNEPALFDRMNRVLLDQGGVLSKIPFHRRDFESSQGDFRFGSYWYHGSGVVESGQEVKVGHVTAGSATVKEDNTASQTWYTSTAVGERLVVAGHQGMYEVTARSASDLTIYPEYRGDTAKGVTLTVTPNGMRRWYLYTNKDTVFAGDVIVDYQKVHPYLKNDNDPILFECPDTVRYRVEMIAARQNKYSADAARLREDYVDALRREIKANGGDAVKKLPQGLGGRPPLFVQRGRYFGDKK